MKKTMVIFGGSGGLGSQVAEYFKDKYNILSFSSKAVDITNDHSVKGLLHGLPYLPEIVLNFVGNNYDGFVHKTDEDLTDNCIDVNINGSVNIARNVLPYMRQQNYGRIIFISSILAYKDVMGTGIYSSCKAFIDRFVKSISAENISKGITANSIQLGYFDGGMTYKLPDPDAIKETIPLKRWGRIEELCNTIEFFINTEYATGVNLPLTGGV